MSKTKPKRNTTSIDKDAEAEELLEAYCERRGAMKKVVVSRLIKWFVRSSDVVRDAVQDWVPDEVRPAYADALREMAVEVESAGTKDSPMDDNINPVVHPHRPEQVLKPKKRRAS